MVRRFAGLGRHVVTGAARFIGSHLANRLLSDGHTVLGSDSFIQGHVCVLPLSMAGDGMCMLPKRR
jgi:nucleoside-diphosphate-sugar epimerase